MAQASSNDPRASLIWRALTAIPLLLFTYLCQKTMFESIDSLGRHEAPILEAGVYPLANGSSIPLKNVYFGSKAFDTGLQQLVTAFIPVFVWLRKERTLQALTFFVDLFPLHMVWIIESMRVGSVAIGLKFPMIWALSYNLLGIGRVAPIYFFLHYVLCPTNKNTYPFERSTHLSYAKAILPAAIIGLLMPTIGQFCPHFTPSTRQAFCAYFQLFPILVSSLHYLFTLFIPNKAAINQAQEHTRNANTDMPYLRFAYGFAVLFSGAYYLRVWTSNPSLMFQYYLQNLVWPPKDFASLAQGMEYVLIWDQISGYGAGLLWVVLHFWDLKRAGRLHSGWAKIVSALVALVLVGGPGAAIAGMWWWREEILASDSSAMKGNEKKRKVA